MNAIVVVSLDLPTGEEITEVLEHINPPKIPHFAGQVRVAVTEDAQTVIDWLEDKRENLS